MSTASRASTGAPAAPGLRFMGYLPAPGQIGDMGREGRRAAKGITAELAAQTRAPRVAATREPHRLWLTASMLLPSGSRTNAP